jgi:hypothetical protein
MTTSPACSTEQGTGPFCMIVTCTKQCRPDRPQANSCSTSQICCLEVPVEPPEGGATTRLMHDVSAACVVPQLGAARHPCELTCISKADVGCGVRQWPPINTCSAQQLSTRHQLGCCQQCISGAQTLSHSLASSVGCRDCGCSSTSLLWTRCFQHSAIISLNDGILYRIFLYVYVYMKQHNGSARLWNLEVHACSYLG